MARLPEEKIVQLRWEHPPYSPDLAPSDLHPLDPLKTHHGVRCFMVNEVESEGTKRPRQQNKYVHAADYLM